MKNNLISKINEILDIVIEKYHDVIKSSLGKFKKIKILKSIYLSLIWRGRSKIKILKGPISGFVLIKNKHLLGSILLKGRYEPVVQSYFKKHVKKGNIVLDVGSNLGIHSLCLSKLVGKQGHVFSFEPAKKHRMYFENVIRLNKLNNITTSPFGIWDHSTEKILYSDSLLSWVLDSPPKNRKNVKSSKIQLISIDEFVKKNSLQQLDFIKMDIDGAEIKAISGMKEVLTKLRPTLLIECHSRNYFNYLKEQILKYNYKIEKFKDGPLYYLFAISN